MFLGRVQLPYWCRMHSSPRWHGRAVAEGRCRASACLRFFAAFAMSFSYSHLYFRAHGNWVSLYVVDRFVSRITSIVVRFFWAVDGTTRHQLTCTLCSFREWSSCIRRASSIGASLHRAHSNASCTPASRLAHISAGSLASQHEL